jgi:hypothetical protein
MNEATEPTTPRDRGATTRRAVLRAPAFLAAAPASPGVFALEGEQVGAAAPVSDLQDKLQELRRLRAAVGAAYPPTPYTLAEERAAMPQIEAATEDLDAAVKETADLPPRCWAHLVVKARAAYEAADRDIRTGVMIRQDSSHGLVVAIVEDVLALAGQPVPR